MEKFTANTIYITGTSKATGTDSSITREQEAKTRRNDESCLTASRSLGPRNSFPALSRCSAPISATVGGPLDGRTRDKVEGQANVTENEMIKGTSAYQIVSTETSLVLPSAIFSECWQPNYPAGQKLKGSFGESNQP